MTGLHVLSDHRDYLFITDSIACDACVTWLYQSPCAGLDGESYGFGHAGLVNDRIRLKKAITFNIIAARFLRELGLSSVKRDLAGSVMAPECAALDTYHIRAYGDTARESVYRTEGFGYVFNVLQLPESEDSRDFSSSGWWRNVRQTRYNV